MINVIFIGLFVFMLVLLVCAFFLDIEKQEQKKNEYIQDYTKWAKLEVDRIIGADNKDKTLF